MNNLPVMIFIASLENRAVEWCNRQMEKEVGYTKGEMEAMGKDFFKTFIPPPDYPRALSIRDIFISGSTHYQDLSKIYIHRGTRKIWVFSHIQLLRQGELQSLTPRLLCTLLPIHDKPAIESISEDDTPFQKTSPSLPDSIKEKLTTTEKDLLPFLAYGCCEQEIATKKQRSLSTIQTHVKHIMHKMKVHTRVKLTALLHHYGY